MKPAYLKILIVEDDVLIGKMIRDFFNHEGYPYEYLFAEDGEEALKICLTQKPDVLITDINIPKMTGIELIAHLRTLPDFAVMPIIAITAGSDELKALAVKVGAHLVLSKPLQRKELIQKVDELLSASPFFRP